jgi:YihY family inner membrane protein
MRPLTDAAARVLRHPGAFALAVLRGFRANQGLLLAGAVAYYALLSMVPLLILVVIGALRLFDEARLFATLAEYLEFVVPGQSAAFVEGLRAFLVDRDVVGGILLVTMLFFSSLAFTVLENAMSVIFFHRVEIKRRHFLVSALMPYLFMLFLAIGFLVVTVVSGLLRTMSVRNVTLLGMSLSLSPVAGFMLYLVGVLGEVLLLTAIYLVMPVGRLSVRHALIGGVTATVLWEVTRHLLVWYFDTISQIHVVYGALTTAIAVLLSAEIGAIILLLGAQVIAEYERIGREPLGAAPEPMRTA